MSKLEFQESDVSPGKTEVEQGKSVLFIEYLVNHKTLIPLLQPLSSPWVLYRSKLKAYQLVFSAKFNKKNKLICAISKSDFNLAQRSGVCVWS